MKFNAFVQHLVTVGFSEKEARVYLACLEAGTASVAVVAEKAGVKRSTAYVMLESLSRRGLVQPATSGKKSNVCVLAPTRVLAMIEEEKKAVEQKHGFFSSILPEFMRVVSAVPATEMVEVD